MAARPSLSPPIMARDSVLRHLHTHDPPGKAHPAGAGPPDPLRRCEKNLHAMPIESDTSVLMAAKLYGMIPRRVAPRSASVRARTHTVPCFCTLAPAAEHQRTLASMPPLPCDSFIARCARAVAKGLRHPVDAPDATGAAAEQVPRERYVSALDVCWVFGFPARTTLCVCVCVVCDLGSEIYNI